MIRQTYAVAVLRAGREVELPRLRTRPEVDHLLARGHVLWVQPADRTEVRASNAPGSPRRGYRRG